MKILIVDDNVAVQEIVKDILAGEGHNVRVAATVSEAVDKILGFDPDMVVLDSRVAGEDGLRAVSRIREEDPDRKLSVVLLKGVSEVVPTDEPFIRASVDKPFKASDILGAINEIVAQDAEAEAQAAAGRRGRRKKGSRRSFRRKKEKPEAPPEGAPEKQGISFGSNYVIFEPSPDGIYRFLGLFNPDKYDIMVITSKKAKAIKERFSYGTMDVVPVSVGGRAGTMDARDIGTMTARIRQFIDGAQRPVVIIDSFGEVMAANGNNQSLLMLQQLISGRSKACTVAVSVDAAGLTDKDRGIFLHDMVKFEFGE